MKYLKTYEDINEPQIGDYVVCDFDRFYSERLSDLSEFMKYKIGKCVAYEYDEVKLYAISYDQKIPDEFFNYIYEENSICVEKEDIKFFSSDKKDCEAYLASNKYNL